MAVATFIELEALTGRSTLVWRRRSSSCLCARKRLCRVRRHRRGLRRLAVQRAFDVPSSHMHASAGIIAQLGAFDGLVALGLWAVGDGALRRRDARPHLEAEQLRTAAELARLRANLQPHFLFNTLSTIAGSSSKRRARREI